MQTDDPKVAGALARLCSSTREEVDGVLYDVSTLAVARENVRGALMALGWRQLEEAADRRILLLHDDDCPTLQRRAGMGGCTCETVWIREERRVSRGQAGRDLPAAEV